MDKMLKDNIRQITAEVLNISVEKIRDDSNISEIVEFDSLAQVMVLSELQDRLKISLNLNEPAKIKSLNDIVKLFEKS